MSVNGDYALINRKIKLYPHASSHELGGSDQVNLDASQIVSGTLAEDRVPHTFNNPITINADLTANRLKLLLDSILDSGGVERIKFDTANNKVIIPSSLTVQGDLTYVSSTNLQVEDNIITLNAGESGDGVSLGSAGIEIDRGTLSNAQILFDDTNDKFIFKLADGTYMPVDIGSLSIGGTTVIDNSRNLKNINSLRFVKNTGVEQIILEALDADDTNTLRSSSFISLRAKYWDGSSSVMRNLILFNRMVSADTYEFVIRDYSQLIDLLQVKSSGDVNIPSGGLMIGGTTVIDSSRNLVGINRVLQDIILDKSGKADASRIMINCDSGYSPIIWFKQGGVNRFSMYVSTDGSKLMISHYDDNGDYLGSPLRIDRSSGEIHLYNTLRVYFQSSADRGITLQEEDTGRKWVILHRGSAFSTTPKRLIFTYYDGSSWHEAIRIDPGSPNNIELVGTTNITDSLSIGGTTVIDSDRDITCRFILVSNDFYGKIDLERTDVPQKWAIQIEPDGTLRFFDATNSKSMLKIKPNTGDINIPNGGLQIGGTTVVDSSRNLQNVSIDRSTTNLTPALIFHTTSVQSVASGSSQTPVTITTKYIYTNLGIDYKQIRLIAYGMCGNGFGWRLYVVDDGGATICAISGTATSYERKDSGWVTLPSTEYIQLKLKGEYNADAGTYDSAYAKNIALFVR